MADDRELWKKFINGDGAAFDTWYRDMAPRLRVFLRHVVRDQQAAEDVMQETFTQLWRNPYRFDPDRGSLRAYLFGIARKHSAEWWRKQKPEERLGVEPSLQTGIEAASMVNEAFGRLPLEQQSLLWLREVEGQSYTELAVILDIPIGTVRSRLFAAREALRAAWGLTHQSLGDHHDL